MKTFSTHLKASPSGFDAIISTPRVDRDGEVVLPSGLKNRDEYLANPLVYWAHEWASNPAAEPIGKATRLDVHNDRIESSAIFAPTAKGRNVEALVKGGFVSRTSIGFSGHVEDVKGIPTFTEWELLEYSVVPMPANVDAAITGVKSAVRWLADQLPGEVTETDVDRIVWSGLDVEALVKAASDADWNFIANGNTVTLIDPTLSVADRRVLTLRKRRQLVVGTIERKRLDVQINPVVVTVHTTVTARSK